MKRKWINKWIRNVKLSYHAPEWALTSARNVT